jgi:quercetin dioxygenase-like cupin family protein
LKYTLLYTGSQGDSHFKNVEVDFEAVNFAPPAPPVELSSYTEASRLVFFRTAKGWFGDWHPAPKKQFFCCLSGTFEIIASDGEVRVFHAGDVFLLEDTTGKGHKSRTIGEEDFTAAVIQL